MATALTLQVKMGEKTVRILSAAAALISDCGRFYHYSAKYPACPILKFGEEYSPSHREVTQGGLYSAD